MLSPFPVSANIKSFKRNNNNNNEITIDLFMKICKES